MFLSLLWFRKDKKPNRPFDYSKFYRFFAKATMQNNVRNRLCYYKTFKIFSVYYETGGTYLSMAGCQ